MDPAETRGDLLQTFLAARDEPCPGCGYSMRGLVGNVCPECRRPIELGVRGAARLPPAAVRLAWVAIVIQLISQGFTAFTYIPWLIQSGPGAMGGAAFAASMRARATVGVGGAAVLMAVTVFLTARALTTGRRLGRDAGAVALVMAALWSFAGGMVAWMVTMITWYAFV